MLLKVQLFPFTDARIFKNLINWDVTFKFDMCGKAYLLCCLKNKPWTVPQSLAISGVLKQEHCDDTCHLEITMSLYGAREAFHESFS